MHHVPATPAAIRIGTIHASRASPVTITALLIAIAIHMMMIDAIFARRGIAAPGSR